MSRLECFPALTRLGLSKKSLEFSARGVDSDMNRRGYKGLTRLQASFSNQWLITVAKQLTSAAILNFVKLGSHTATVVWLPEFLESDYPVVTFNFSF